jgi:hypothetical protein
MLHGSQVRSCLLGYREGLDLLLEVVVHVVFVLLIVLGGLSVEIGNYAVDRG